MHSDLNGEISLQKTYVIWLFTRKRIPDDVPLSFSDQTQIPYDSLLWKYGRHTVGKKRIFQK